MKSVAFGVFPENSIVIDYKVIRIRMYCNRSKTWSARIIPFLTDDRLNFYLFLHQSEKLKKKLAIKLTCSTVYRVKVGVYCEYNSEEYR